MKKILITLVCLLGYISYVQAQDSTAVYKKRVLETTEIDFLASYYTQDGNNAAVSGGIGTEELTDINPTIVVSIPLNDDDVLTIDTSVSAYSSASSSNVGPFDGNQPADPFVESSGASSSDVWVNGTVSYSHSSDDRNNIWTGKLSVSSEYDYFSLGFGGIGLVSGAAFVLPGFRPLRGFNIVVTSISFSHSGHSNSVLPRS